MKHTSEQESLQLGTPAEPAPTEASASERGSADWRDIERQLDSLSGQDLRKALEAAGVKSVLPSHKKPRTDPQHRGDATARWAAGEWARTQQIEAQSFPPLGSLPVDVANDRRPRVRVRFVAVLTLMLGLCASAVGVAWLASQSRSTDDEAAVVLPRVTAIAKKPATTALQAPPLVDLAALSRGTTARGTTTEAADETVPVSSALAVEPEASDSAQDRLLEKRAEQGDVEAQVELARRHLVRGQSREAVRWAKLAQAQNPRSIEYRILLGDAQRQNGDIRAAKRTYEHALGRAPHNLEVRARLQALP